MVGGGPCCGAGGLGIDLGATGGAALAPLSELEREIGGEIALRCIVGVKLIAFKRGGLFISIGGGSGRFPEPL